MDISAHYGFIYSILIGITTMFYLKQIGNLIKMRRYAIYYTVPVLWAFVFIGLLLTTYQQQVALNLSFGNLGILIITTACYYWIGMLLFPEVERIDLQDQFAYLDYYEHFRKQIVWIMSLAICILLLNFWFSWQIQTCNIGFLESLNSFFTFRKTIILSVFVIAFFTEHKGLILLLVWTLIGVLFII